MTFAPPPPATQTTRALRETLLREAAELDRRIAELGDADAARSVIASEREALRADRVNERRIAVPRLGPVRRAISCGVPWDALCGEGRVRACTCGARVVDPRRLEGREVRALLGLSTASAAIHLRPDGTAMARSCPVAQRRLVRRSLGALLSVMVLACATSLTIHALRPPPAATLQYLSSRSRLGARPQGMPRQVPIAPRR